MVNYNSEEIKLAVWKKGNIMSSNDPAQWRQDECWARIWFQYYWNRNSQYWWEIDHITPESNWWSNSLYNLRPLQRENNLSKSNWRLVCKIKADWVNNS